jgi:hypothetical protein
MTARTIDKFFRTLSRQLQQPVQVIVTGAAAGALMGRVRPSVDIDFAISLIRAGGGTWVALEAAIQETVKRTGIQANYAADIDRWGQITLMDYRRRTLPYRTFGKLEVRILEPAYWAIGKLSRYLDPDVQDLIAVFKRQRPVPARLVSVWGAALKASVRSTAQGHFRRQVEHFLRTYGRRIWGAEFDVEATVRRFQKAAGLL